MLFCIGEQSDRAPEDRRAVSGCLRYFCRMWGVVSELGRAPAADDVAQAPIMPFAFYLWSGWAVLITTAGAGHVSYASLVSTLTPSLTVIEPFACNHLVLLLLQITNIVFIYSAWLR